MYIHRRHYSHPVYCSYTLLPEFFTLLLEFLLFSESDLTVVFATPCSALSTVLCIIVDCYTCLVLSCIFLPHMAERSI